MKKRTIVFGIVCMICTQAFSQFDMIEVDNSLELTQVSRVFKKDNPTEPLDTVYYSSSKTYSDNKKFYLELVPEEFQYKLMTCDDRFIANVPYTSFYDKIIWLQNCVVIENDVKDFKNPVIYVVNLKHGKLVTYSVTGGISYIGQSENHCYFSTAKDSVSIGKYFIPKEGTIFSINEKGPARTNAKEREDKDNNIRLYYDKSFSVVREKNSEGVYSCNFHYFDSVWTCPEPIDYFDKQNVHHSHGAIYVKINSNCIYRFDANSVTKVVDCDTLSIKQFAIENNYLIYSMYYSYQKPQFGMLNLETMQTLNPILIKKM